MKYFSSFKTLYFSFMGDLLYQHKLDTGEHDETLVYTYMGSPVHQHKLYRSFSEIPHEHFRPS